MRQTFTPIPELSAKEIATLTEGNVRRDAGGCSQKLSGP